MAGDLEARVVALENEVKLLRITKPTSTEMTQAFQLAANSMAIAAVAIEAVDLLGRLLAVTSPPMAEAVSKLAPAIAAKLKPGTDDFTMEVIERLHLGWNEPDRWWEK